MSAISDWLHLVLIRANNPHPKVSGSNRMLGTRHKIYYACKMTALGHIDTALGSTELHGEVLYSNPSLALSN